jgi:YD repeat-containing protein
MVRFSRSGRNTSRTRVDAAGRVTDVISYQYSDRDLLTREESPVSGVTAHAYTEHGELRETTDARGVTVTRAVDAADRVTFVDYPGTALDRTYTWGTAPATHTRGRLTAIGNETTAIAYAYDAHGRLVQDGDLLFTHDANGNLATVTYPGGLVASYAHDAMDREQSLTVQPAGGTAVPVVAGTPGASYRPFGPLAGLTFGSGLAELRAHDFRYVPGSISLRQGASDLFAWEYMSDALGNLTEVAETAPEVERRKFAYQDWQYYLVSASARGAARSSGGTTGPATARWSPAAWRRSVAIATGSTLQEARRRSWNRCSRKGLRRGSTATTPRVT